MRNWRTCKSEDGGGRVQRRPRWGGGEKLATPETPGWAAPGSTGRTCWPQPRPRDRNYSPRFIAQPARRCFSSRSRAATASGAGTRDPSRASPVMTMVRDVTQQRTVNPFVLLHFLTLLFATTSSFRHENFHTQPHFENVS